MDINFDEISPEQMKKIASSPAAKALMAMLQRNGGADVERAMSAAKKGDMAQMQRTLAAFLSDPKAQALLTQLQEDPYGRNGK